MLKILLIYLDILCWGKFWRFFFAVLFLKVCRGRCFVFY